MSDSPNTPDAPAGGGDGPKPAKPAKGVKGALGKKIGPLPLGVWLLAIGGGLVVAAMVRRRAGNGPVEGVAEEAGGFGWDEPDPGGTRPGIGGNAGSDWSTDWTAPLPELPGWIDAPWQDPPEASVPGTAGGAGNAQPNNGGPAGTVRHRYVPEGPNKPRCKVCGKWRDTSVHTNRDAPKKSGGNGGGGNAGGGQPAGPNTGVAFSHVTSPTPAGKHRWVPIGPNKPKCKVCGKWRDTADHTNR